MDGLPDYSNPNDGLVLAERYRYHAPKNDQLPRFEAIRSETHRLATLIDKNCPPGREKSLAQTFLQQACQMANAAIAIGEVQRPVPAEPVTIASASARSVSGGVVEPGSTAG